ncbi:nuclear transport factor 2 family protein [Sorangium sp. So ce260]|uniref:nuclear transport factor 2 family protein n=1 Tax=Sorangium sp. So ce260 TaxID=3133291 RepID=UPI003F5D9E51
MKNGIIRRTFQVMAASTALLALGGTMESAEADPVPDCLSVSEHAQIAALVQEFYEASTNGDIDAIDDLISIAPSAVFMGTAPGEVYYGHNDIVQWWEDMFTFLDSLGYPNNGGLPIETTGGLFQLSQQGATAWVADDPTFAFLGGDVPTRLTLVFHKYNGEWRIHQGHWSVGLPNEELPLLPSN